MDLYLSNKAVIAEVHQETVDVWTYRLEQAQGEKPVRFAPGQFTMVGYPGVGEAPISVSAFDNTGHFSLTIRAVGRVTDYLTRLRPGQVMYYRGPYGRGWPLSAAQGHDLLVVAGGLGMAPLRPVIHRVLAERGAYTGVELIYGSREPEAMLFGREMTEWSAALSVSLTVDEVPPSAVWPHEVGLVTRLLDRLELRPARTIALICGPEIMMRFVSRQLLRLGVAPSRIYLSLERRMRCGFGQCGHCQHGPFFVCKDGPVFSHDQVQALPDSFL